MTIYIKECCFIVGKPMKYLIYKIETDSDRFYFTKSGLRAKATPRGRIAIFVACLTLFRFSMQSDSKEV